MTMGGGGRRTEAIMREISALRGERDELDSRIRFLESQLRAGKTGAPTTTTTGLSSSTKLSAAGLSSDMIRRYSRHLLLPGFGVEGQRKLSQSSVLVVGAEGMGSAVATYLAACGVGYLGIVDGKDVQLGDLHGQTMHVEAYVGQPKVKSAAATCRAINSSVTVFEYHLKLKAENALNIVRQYDIVVDATNSLSSRYMLSDCCILLNKPLISGSALGLEGQLSVYNHNGSPCYRCHFPDPPASSAAFQSSSDTGILGAVPGVIGCLQALEAMKVATGVGEPLCGRVQLFDALSSRFKTVKIHQRSTCTTCGEISAFNEEAFTTFDYDRWTQPPPPTAATSLSPTLPDDGIGVSCREYKRVRDSGKPHLLLDVRPAHHFQIASIPGSLNIPLPELEEKLPRLRAALHEVADSLRGKQRPLYFVCRRGDESQVAVRMLRENGFVYASHVVGGLEAWVRDVDPEFPAYW